MGSCSRTVAGMLGEGTEWKAAGRDGMRRNDGDWDVP